MNKKDNSQKKKTKCQSQVDEVLRDPHKEQISKFLKYVNQVPFDDLKSVINYMLDLHSKGNEENKKKINKVLLNSDFISLISKNKDAIFYGTKNLENDDTTTKKPPMKPTTIYQLIDIILKKDKDLANKLIAEVFNFDKTKLISKQYDNIDKIVNPDSEEFRNLIINNDKAHQLIIEMVFNKRVFQTLFEKENKLKEKEIELKEERERHQNDVSSKDEKIKNLSNKIESLESNINDLNTDLNEAQRNINFFKSKSEILSKIKNENEQLKKDSKNDKNVINDLKDEKEKLEKKLEASEADSALKSHRISELSMALSASETEARSTIMKNLIQKASSPLYYLSMFCQEFNETQSLSEESASYFVDTINQLESAFDLMGAKKFGKPDEKVKYDASIHKPMEKNLANGDYVKITEPGWKIEDKIFIKAKVEKVEDK